MPIFNVMNYTCVNMRGTDFIHTLKITLRLKVIGKVNQNWFYSKV